MKISDKLTSFATKYLMHGSTQVPNPDAFDDPFAKEIDWYPIARNRANFKTHSLIQVKSMIYRFQATTKLKLMSCIPILIGIVPIFMAYKNFKGTNELGDIVFLIGFSSIMAFTAFFLMRRSKQVYTFNGRLQRVTNNDKHLPFSQIYAIQLLKKYISGKNSYDCFELNLVLKNKERINIIAHADADAIRSDANKIAGFLNIPLWDGSLRENLMEVDMEEQLRKFA